MARKSKGKKDREHEIELALLKVFAGPNGFDILLLMGVAGGFGVSLMADTLGKGAGEYSMQDVATAYANGYVVPDATDETIIQWYIGNGYSEEEIRKKFENDVLAVVLRKAYYRNLGVVSQSQYDKVVETYENIQNVQGFAGDLIGTTGLGLGLKATDFAGLGDNVGGIFGGIFSLGGFGNLGKTFAGTCLALLTMRAIFGTGGVGEVLKGIGEIVPL